MIDNNDQDINDEMLIRAMRKRLLDDISRRGEAERVVNNIYGGGVGGGGVSDQMGAEMPDEDQSYFVDILRENYDPGDSATVIDPETGEKVSRQLPRGGWGKYVHRFSQPKKKALEE